jgi:predicted ferric reductase
MAIPRTQFRDRSVLLSILAGLMIAVPVVIWATRPFLLLDLQWPYALITVARLLSVVAFVIMVLQFVMASRIPLIERGVGHDRLIHVHRSFGRWAVGLALFHGVMIVAHQVSTMGRIRTTVPQLLGSLALAGFLVIAVTAIFWKRFQMRYEQWHRVHQAGYVLFPLVFAHSILITPSSESVTGSAVGRIYWFALFGIFLAAVTYRLVRTAANYRRPYRVTEVEEVTHDTWNLRFAGRPMRYLPGQFVFIRLEQNGNLASSHPFTLSSSPLATELSVTPKEIGDFTGSLGETSSGARVVVDGPYGIFSYLNYPAQKYCFLAGGIGITPFLSMLRYMRDSGDRRDVVLVWGNKTQADIAYREELEAIAGEIPGLRIVHVLSKEPEWDGPSGYLNAETLQEQVPDLSERELMVCGPPVMVDFLKQELPGLGIPARRLRFERFAL